MQPNVAPVRIGRFRLSDKWQVRFIRFLLWACERRYSPEDHWTLKDAFEVSTLELRDQFMGAFSDSFAQAFSSGRKRADLADEDADQLSAGRMKGSTRRRR